MQTKIHQITTKRFLGNVREMRQFGPARQNSSHRGNDAHMKKGFQPDPIGLQEPQDGSEKFKQNDDKQQVIDESNRGQQKLACERLEEFHPTVHKHEHA
jgi:hypothetical protein